jgi:Zn-finger nucleic acid-binding protein
MPLLVSPIDGETPMQQIVRNGIEIDRCPKCGGVWLDKGELEKILLAAQQALHEDREEYVKYRQEHPDERRDEYREHSRAPMPSRRSQPAHYRDDDDYDDYYKNKHGKKSSIKRFFELFD